MQLPFFPNNQTGGNGMASSTAHPNHQLISSEDVEGTTVYGVGKDKVGEIDHR